MPGQMSGAVGGAPNTNEAALGTLFMEFLSLRESETMLDMLLHKIGLFLPLHADVINRNVITQFFFKANPRRFLLKSSLRVPFHCLAFAKYDEKGWFPLRSRGQQGRAPSFPHQQVHNLPLTPDSPVLENHSLPTPRALPLPH